VLLLSVAQSSEVPGAQVGAVVLEFVRIHVRFIVRILRHTVRVLVVFVVGGNPNTSE
jgi:hypothetical protein